MEDFVNIRRPFIALTDKDVIFAPTGVQSCREWAAANHNVSDEMYDQCVRGYIAPGRIQFFKGQDHSEVSVCPRVLDTVIAAYMEEYGEAPDEFCNGCIMGEPGEQWPPIKVVSLEGWC